MTAVKKLATVLRIWRKHFQSGENIGKRKAISIASLVTVVVSVDIQQTMHKKNLFVRTCVRACVRNCVTACKWISISDRYQVSALHVLTQFIQRGEQYALDMYLFSSCGMTFFQPLVITVPSSSMPASYFLNVGVYVSLMPELSSRSNKR